MNTTIKGNFQICISVPLTLTLLLNSVLNFILLIDLLLNLEKLFRSERFETRYVFFSCLHLILFTSTE